MIYKVKMAEIITSPKGHQFFSLTLNNDIIAKKIFPFRSKRINDELYNLYCKHNGISFIVGKYIYLNVENNQYGYVFDSIDCFDIISEFENRISSYKTPFRFYREFYDLLNRRNRRIEADGTLRLNFPYEKFGFNKEGVCYQIDHKDILSSLIETLECYKSPFRMDVHFNIYEILKEKKYGTIKKDIIELPSPYTNYEVNKYGLCYLKSENLYGFVDFDNISVIYDVIEKRDMCSSSDVIKNYSLYKDHIFYSYERTKRYSSKVTSRSSGILLRVGDLITKEYYDLALK